MGVPIDMRFFNKESIKKYYENAKNSIEDPIFTGFTLAIDKNTSPLFYSCNGKKTFAEDDTLRGNGTDTSLSEALEAALEQMYKFRIMAFPDSYEINTLSTKDNLGDRKAGYGLQSKYYLDNLLYGAVDYIYMVDKVSEGMYNDGVGITDVGDGSVRNVYTDQIEKSASEDTVLDLFVHGNPDIASRYIAMSNGTYVEAEYDESGSEPVEIKKEEFKSISVNDYLDMRINEAQNQLGKNGESESEPSELEKQHQDNYEAMMKAKAKYDTYFDSNSDVGKKYTEILQTLGPSGTNRELGMQYNDLKNALNKIQKEDLEGVSDFLDKWKKYDDVNKENVDIGDTEKVVNKSYNIEYCDRSKRLYARSFNSFSEEEKRIYREVMSGHYNGNASKSPDGDVIIHTRVILGTTEYPEASSSDWYPLWKEAGLIDGEDVICTHTEFDNGDIENKKKTRRIFDNIQAVYDRIFTYTLTASGRIKLTNYLKNKKFQERDVEDISRDISSYTTKIDNAAKEYFSLLKSTKHTKDDFPSKIKNTKNTSVSTTSSIDGSVAGVTYAAITNYEWTLDNYWENANINTTNYSVINDKPFNIPSDINYDTSKIGQWKGLYELITKTSIEISSDKADKSKEKARTEKKKLDVALYGVDPKTGEVLTQDYYINNLPAPGYINDVSLPVPPQGENEPKTGEPFYLQYLRAKYEYEHDGYSNQMNELESFMMAKESMKELEEYNQYATNNKLNKTTTQSRLSLPEITPEKDDKGDVKKDANGNVIYDTSAYEAARYQKVDKQEVPQTVYDMIGFVNGMKKLTDEYPYVLQSITGLDEAYKKYFEVKDPYMGSGDDKISIECLEFLDLRVSSMFNKYFNAVYDRQYRRERVPINLRRFNCSIFVHDIRNFSNTLKDSVSDPDNVSAIVQFALNYISVIEFKFYDCEIVPGETGDVFEDVSNVTSGDLSKTRFTFTYGNCVINFLPFDDLRKYLLNNKADKDITPSVVKNTIGGVQSGRYTGSWGSSNETVGPDGNFRRWFDKSALGNVNNNDYREYIRRDSSVAVDDHYKTTIVNNFANNSVGYKNKELTEMDDALRRIVVGISASTGIPTTGVADALNIKYIGSILDEKDKSAPVAKNLGNVNNSKIIDTETTEYIGNTMSDDSGNVNTVKEDTNLVKDLGNVNK